MDRKTKILLGIFALIIVLVTMLVYFRFYIERNYIISSEVDCDPDLEACFVRTCEEDCEVPGEVTYYKLRSVNASQLPLCDPHEEECPDILCQETASCHETLCSPDTVPEEEFCSEPPLLDEEEAVNEAVSPEAFSETEGEEEPETPEMVQ
jgi:hypothetical protein